MAQLIAYRAFGLECHICGYPTSWFCGTVSAPCGCGIRDAEHRQQVIAAVAEAKRRIKAEATPPKPAPEPPVEDVALIAEGKAWREILAVLMELEAAR